MFAFQPEDICHIGRAISALRWARSFKSAPAFATALGLSLEWVNSMERGLLILTDADIQHVCYVLQASEELPFLLTLPRRRLPQKETVLGQLSQ